MTEKEVVIILYCRRIDDALTSGVTLSGLLFAATVFVVAIGFLPLSDSTGWEEAFLNLLPLFCVLCVFGLLYHLILQSTAKRAIPLEHEEFIRGMAKNGHSAASFQMMEWAEARESEWWYLHWLDQAAEQGCREAKKRRRRLRH